jgi:hypothetical protein
MSCPRRLHFRRSPTAATAGTLAALFLFFAGCAQPAAKPPAREPVRVTTPLAPSPRLIVGRVLAVELAAGMAFVDVDSDAPERALVDGAELTTRTRDLRETGRLRTSRYVRGRTLGASIVAGQPSPGDEVVWHAP